MTAPRLPAPRAAAVLPARRTRRWLLPVLLGAGLALPVAGEPVRPAARLPALLAQPAAAAASAARSALDAALRPVTQAASAALSQPAAIAASAASAVQAVVEQALRPAVTAASAAPAARAPAPAASPATAVSAVASAPAAAASPAAATAADTQACMRVDGQGARCGQALQLVFKTVVLPPGRQGVPYKPRLMVTGGVPRYAFTVTEGRLPAGLSLTADGHLGGVPTAKGPQNFTLQISDSSSPPFTARQAYALRVDAAPKAQAAAATITALAPEDAQALANSLEDGTISSWMLLPEDLDALLPLAAASAPDAAASAPKPQTARLRPRRDEALPSVADPEQVRDMLTPMLHIEYATQTLFESALEARRCAYYSALVTAAALKKVAAVTVQCPPGPDPTPPAGAAAPPEAAASAPIPLPVVYAELLPAALKSALVAQAEWIHPLASAKPVHWTDDGCGCVAVEATEHTYGIYPFWQAREDEPQKIRFSLFSRIGYLGVQLTDSGGYRAPGHAVDKDTDFVRVAQRFGTQVDLVIQRSDWAGLLDRANQDAIIERAVTEAMQLVNTPMNDTYTRVKHAVLPFWGEPTFLFDGLTVFFDNAPTDAQGAEKFRVFYGKFALGLIAAMRQAGRDLTLNIVVPDHLMGEQGAYGFTQLMGYLDAARPPRKGAAPASGAGLAEGPRTNVSVSLLVLLREPTGASKKALRARVDNTETIQGHRRVEFLDAIVPLLFHAGGEPQAPVASIAEGRMDLDLAYFKWQYGGAGFWPVPLADTADGVVISNIIAHNYADTPASPLRICEFVCPNRSWVRLLFTTLLLTGAVALGLYVWVCRVHQIGRRYILFLWLDGILALLVGFVLYSCDPSLAALRAGRLVLASLLVVAVALGMYFSLKPRVTPP